jgi:hypothetical protein
MEVASACRGQYFLHLEIEVCLWLHQFLGYFYPRIRVFDCMNILYNRTNRCISRYKYVVAAVQCDVYAAMGKICFSELVGPRSLCHRPIGKHDQNQKCLDCFHEFRFADTGVDTVCGFAAIAKNKFGLFSYMTRVSRAPVKVGPMDDFDEWTAIGG